MGRSPRNSADVGVTAWEAVRRALGRLAMRPRVNALAFDAAPPEIVALPLTSGPDIFAGRVENVWRPIAALAVVDLPGAISVVADVDLADVPVTVSANASAAKPEIGVSPSVVSEDELPSYAIRNFDVSAPAVFRADRALTETSARAVPLLTPPRAAALPIARIPAPRLLRPDVRKFDGGRLRASLPTAARVPWTLSRRLPPPGVSHENAWPAERRRLASAATAPLDDVRVIGVFSGVPVGAVRALSLSEDGASLFLWLKSEALGGPPPRFVTLILGQRRSTGVAIRAIA